MAATPKFNFLTLVS